AVVDSDLQTTVVAPSIIYAPGDVFMTLLARMAAFTPVVPVSGSGRARFQPIWAEDVAECVLALVRGRDRDDDGAPGQDRYELGGPETLDYTEITELLLQAAGRPRRLVH